MRKITFKKDKCLLENGDIKISSIRKTYYFGILVEVDTEVKTIHSKTFNNGSK